MKETGRDYVLSPSLIGTGFILFLFLIGSTLVPLFEKWPEKYSRHFQDAFALNHRGVDLRPVELGTRRLLEKRNIYRSETERPNRFFYPPQGLLVTLPFFLLPEPWSYYGFISLCFILMAIFFSLLSRELVGTPPVLSLSTLTLWVFLSYPGLYAFERANTSLLGTVFVFAAFYFLLKRSFLLCSSFLALCVCLKALYLPYAFLLFFLPNRRAAFLTYGGIFLLFSSGTIFTYGSWDPFKHYLSASPYVVDAFSSSFGGTNIGLLSSLSLVVNELGFRDLPPKLMNYSMSFAVLGGLLSYCGWKGKEWGPLFLFGALTYVLVLWQFLSVSYSALPLLLLLPLTEVIYLQNKKIKWLTIIHIIALALIFSPPEFRPPLLRSFRGLYYLLGFGVYLYLLNRSKGTPRDLKLTFKA